ncbi:unnamed protein product, partial [Mesorhabditis belari]|uniref:Uncharacterized protein n=1 Tax=Mesorhabditis belari TaxID=2138241 RepID=A0AAF3EFK9_9BILA
MLKDINEEALEKIGAAEGIEHLSAGTFTTPAFPVKGTLEAFFGAGNVSESGYYSMAIQDPNYRFDCRVSKSFVSRRPQKAPETKTTPLRRSKRAAGKA